jgi:hypothetical protein
VPSHRLALTYRLGYLGNVIPFGAVRIVVYSNDHPPPHVHAVNDGHARFALGETPADVHLVECERMSRRELRWIAGAIVAHHDECLAFWRKIHGRWPHE